MDAPEIRVKKIVSEDAEVEPNLPAVSDKTARNSHEIGTVGNSQITENSEHDSEQSTEEAVLDEGHEEFAKNTFVLAVTNTRYNDPAVPPLPRNKVLPLVQKLLFVMRAPFACGIPRENMKHVSNVTRKQFESAILSIAKRCNEKSRLIILITTRAGRLRYGWFRDTYMFCADTIWNSSASDLYDTAISSDTLHRVMENIPTKDVTFLLNTPWGVGETAERSALSKWGNRASTYFASSVASETNSVVYQAFMPAVLHATYRFTDFNDELLFLKDLIVCLSGSATAIYSSKHQRKHIPRPKYRALVALNANSLKRALDLCMQYRWERYARMKYEYECDKNLRRDEERKRDEVVRARERILKRREQMKKKKEQEKEEASDESGEDLRAKGQSPDVKAANDEDSSISEGKSQHIADATIYDSDATPVNWDFLLEDSEDKQEIAAQEAAKRAEEDQQKQVRADLMSMAVGVTSAEHQQSGDDKGTKAEIPEPEAWDSINARIRSTVDMLTKDYTPKSKPSHLSHFSAGISLLQKQPVLPAVGPVPVKSHLEIIHVTPWSISLRWHHPEEFRGPFAYAFEVFVRGMGRASTEWRQMNAATTHHPDIAAFTFAVAYKPPQLPIKVDLARIRAAAKRPYTPVALSPLHGSADVSSPIAADEMAKAEEPQPPSGLRLRRSGKPHGDCAQDDADIHRPRTGESDLDADQGTTDNGQTQDAAGSPALADQTQSQIKSKPKKKKKKKGNKKAAKNDAFEGFRWFIDDSRVDIEYQQAPIQWTPCGMFYKLSSLVPHYGYDIRIRLLGVAGWTDWLQPPAPIYTLCVPLPSPDELVQQEYNARGVIGICDIIRSRPHHVNVHVVGINKLCSIVLYDSRLTRTFINASGIQLVVDCLQRNPLCAELCAAGLKLLALTLQIQDKSLSSFLTPLLQDVKEQSSKCCSTHLDSTHVHASAAKLQQCLLQYEQGPR